MGRGLPAMNRRAILSLSLRDGRPADFLTDPLCAAKWDHLPEGPFMYVGAFEEAAENAEKMKAGDSYGGVRRAFRAASNRITNPIRPRHLPQCFRLDLRGEYEFWDDRVAVK